MATISCNGCNKTIDENDAFMTANGAVCDICNSNLEVEVMQRKGWQRPENIAVLALGGASFALEFTINGVDYAGLAIGALSLVAAIVLLIRAFGNTDEPAWFRFGRPAVLFLLPLAQLGKIMALMGG